MTSTIAALRAPLPTAPSRPTVRVKTDKDIDAALNRLDRPRLLVTAARYGSQTYERRRDLRRMLRSAVPSTTRLALQKLIPMEADLEYRRMNGGKSYSAARHVDILGALMSEGATFKATPPAPLHAV